MKNISLLLLSFFLIPALSAQAENSRDSGFVGGLKISDVKSARTSAPAPRSQGRQPVVINMSQGSSGGHNRNFPSQQPARSSAQPRANRQPSYGQIHWSAPVQNRTQVQPWTPAANQPGRAASSANPRPVLKSYSRPGVRAAVAVHHHAYTQGYVRKKLQKIGVTKAPNLITDRAEIIHTDRLHSTIGFPKFGPAHAALSVKVLSPRHFNDPVVRRQMVLVNGRDFAARINRFNLSENRANHYYWHQDNGFNYCHFIDPSGYHWWGWYVGDQFFWTRHFGDRWWWYDSDFDRWCFWNNNNWWWQDPYHLGDLYCYNNDNYIPCNSANDQVVVTAPSNPNLQATNSPDGTRTVKVIADSQDAFLYDTADPPTFDPVYLASGVQSVQFSDTNNGRPLEIILKLNDGSFDMFDGYGNPYNPGTADADQAASEDADGGQPPADEPNPPSDNGGTSN